MPQRYVTYTNYVLHPRTGEKDAFSLTGGERVVARRGKTITGFGTFLGSL